MRDIKAQIYAWKGIKSLPPDSATELTSRKQAKLKPRKSVWRVSCSDIETPRGAGRFDHLV